MYRLRNGVTYHGELLMCYSDYRKCSNRRHFFSDFKILQNIRGVSSIGSTYPLYKAINYYYHAG